MVDGKPTLHDRGLAVPAAIATLLLVLVLAGCGTQPKSGAQLPTAGTARSGLTVAHSALSTRAPDARLLLVQTAQPVTATATPVWGYLFGSPSTDKTYIVYVSKGRAMGASEYGSAGLSKAEWPSVPGTDAMQVDSDAAYAKAVAASTLKNPTGYEMGLLTYIPKSEAASSTSKPFTWYVSLESGTATAAVAVDARTGAATAR